MSAVRQRKLTPAEYLAIERQAQFKSEYFDGEMFAMAGAKHEHNRVKDNTARAAGNQLANGPCYPLTSDMKVRITRTGLYTYPDIIIVCDEPQFEDKHRDVLLNPRTIIEVLSDSTEKYDRGAKFRHYQQVEPIAEYILISQDEPVCERFVRQPDGDWRLTVFAGMDAELVFASVPVKIPFTAIYAGITFPEKPLPAAVGTFDRENNSRQVG